MKTVQVHLIVGMTLVKTEKETSGDKFQMRFLKMCNKTCELTQVIKYSLKAI